MLFPSPPAVASTIKAVVYDGTGSSAEDRLIALTLAGIVNRDAPRLYLRNVYEAWSYGETDDQWQRIYEERGNVEFEELWSIAEVIDRFRSFVNGAITYDPTQVFGSFPGQRFLWQGEYAALIGGLTNRLPMSVERARELGLDVSETVRVEDVFDGDPPITVSARLESDSNPWNTPELSSEDRYLTLLRWGLETLLPRCNPTKFYIREITDFAVQQRMFQVNLAGTDDLDFNSLPPVRAEILERVLSYLHAKNPATVFNVYGWIRPEPLVQWIVSFGASFHETLQANLSWHSVFPVPPRSFSPPAARSSVVAKPLESKYYVAFVASEGDASNWALAFQGGAWLSPARGTVPITWGFNLHLFELFPFVAAYYYDTATANDGFVAVTSPLGYAYPDSWPEEVLVGENGAIALSRRLMERFDIWNVYAYKHYAPRAVTTFRGREIRNNFLFDKLAAFQSAAGVKLTLLFDPAMPSQCPNATYGALLFNHVNDGTFYGDVSNLEQAAARIVGILKKKSKPAFVLAGYQRLRGEEFDGRLGRSDLTVARLVQLMALIKGDLTVGQDVEFVTVDQFQALLPQSLQR